jgi:hypothetical protein
MIRMDGVAQQIKAIHLIKQIKAIHTNNTRVGFKHHTTSKQTSTPLIKKKFLFPLNFALWTQSQGYKIWGVTDLPPLKESRPEIPKRGTREFWRRLKVRIHLAMSCFCRLQSGTEGCVVR